MIEKMFSSIKTLTITTGFILCSSSSLFAEQLLSENLHEEQNNHYAPMSSIALPASEQSLQTLIGKSWFNVTHTSDVLEGIAFAKNGDLIFCNVSKRQVLRLTPDKKLSVLVTMDDLSPGGIAVHKDGRIFIAAINLADNKGGIFEINEDGSHLNPIIDIQAGFLPNDLVFDNSGGFYFTDFKGTSTTPEGGVYYVSPDFKIITPVLQNLAMANGIALSGDGKHLWATEFGRNLLHHIELDDATTPTKIGTTIPFHFTGTAPDSMRSDKDGNLYVAIYNHGRILIFNSYGIPIGQILLPDRDNEQNLLTTSLAIDPHSDNLFIVSADTNGKSGSNIFHSKAFTNASHIFSNKEN